MEQQFNSAEWYFPKKITNPNMGNDIKEFLGYEIFKKYQNGNPSYCYKVERVTDMLEFVDHIMSISSFLKQKNNPTKEIRGNEIIITDQISFEGHDYSGFEWDVEALTLFLYVSIIDTTIAKSTYLPVATYIAKCIEDGKSFNNECIIEELQRYEHEYGLSKNFVNVFTNMISKELQKKITDVVLPFWSDRKSQYEQQELSEHYARWMTMPNTEKLSRIAKVLYSVRSKYTHESIRQFIPNDEGYQIIKGQCLLCKKGHSIINLLHDVIVDVLLNTDVDGK